ncbi:MAG: cytochrome c maturation protein CcmE [Myxococcota bacterium]
MSKGVQIAVGVVSVFAGVVWLVATRAPGTGTFQYYESVSSFLGQAPAATPVSLRSSRVHGFVVSGSIHKDLAAGHVDFRIRDDADPGHELEVRLLGLDIPDLFKDGAEVVVEGRFEEGRFLADRVMAKCPSKYEARPGEEA